MSAEEEKSKPDSSSSNNNLLPTSTAPGALDGDLLDDAVATAVAAAAQLAASEEQTAKAKDPAPVPPSSAAVPDPAAQSDTAGAAAAGGGGDIGGGTTNNKGSTNDDNDDDDEEEEVRPSIEVEPNSRAAATKRLSDVGERDVVLNSREDNHKMFLFLEDMVQMYIVLWSLRDFVPTDEDLDRCSRHIVQLLKAGKRYELGGIRDVPRPCLKSSGRILERDDKGAVRELADADATASVRKMLVDRSAHRESFGVLAKESPYKEFKQRLVRNANANRQAEASVATTPASPQVESGDLILESCQDDESESEQQQRGGETKIIYNTGPQQLVFSSAAQIVTMYTINAETQVKAALAVLNELDVAHFVPVVPSDGLLPRSSASSHPRVLLRTSPPNVAEGDAPIAWSVVSDEDVLEFAITFVFEVHLEKDLDYMHSMLPDNHAHRSSEGMSKVPIKDPTTYDVLFGRGGMTNSHVGNRRFRGIIALHRPDYIRAIKMDKPTVARKIVKAIRFGSPPGRFLKKSEDGNWYDVGDRTAAEKTSQGLRERTNAEKKQRSSLRKALRLSKEDMEADDKDGQNAGPATKKPKSLATVVNMAASLAPTLNYVGTNVPVPLSLNMGQATPPGIRRKPESKVKPNSLGLITAGLPPNATDEKGNILVTDYDILLGRGGLTNHHKGNKRFRDIVALHRPDYVRAPKIQKPSVARVIVRAIRNGDPPGRFLRKDDKTGLWMDVGDKKAAEKTSQALREKAADDREKDQGEPSTGATGILVPVPIPSTYLAATTANVMGNILASGTFTGSAESSSNAERSNDNGPKEEPPSLEVNPKEESKETTEPPLQAMLDEVEV